MSKDYKPDVERLIQDAEKHLKQAEELEKMLYDDMEWGYMALPLWEYCDDLSTIVATLKSEAE